MHQKIWYSLVEYLLLYASPEISVQVKNKEITATVIYNGSATSAIIETEI